MNAAARTGLVTWAACAAALALGQDTPSGPTAGDLAGAWAGTATHEGETTAVALELEPGDDGKILIKASIPAIHLASQPIARAALQVQGNEVRLGPFTFMYAGETATLSGTLPEALVPVYSIPVVLRRVARAAPQERPGPTAPAARPVWVFDAGAPLWAGATFADGVVYVGAEDGRLHALDARTGERRWSFRAGGAIRTRATVAGGEVFFQADDGFLYKLAAASGEERFRMQVVERPIERLPFDNPKSRFDRFGSDVAVASGRLYLGTHDGRVLALDPAQGARIWEFAAGDSVLAAPAVDSGRVYFGSYDRHVYALDAATGQLLWKQDTKGAVVSTPAVAGDRIVVGNRCYDLLALDARSGAATWKSYYWFSWVESSASVRGSVAYLGSSDSAGAFAFDVRTGERRWSTDVFGWAWGQPAVTEARVYVGAASQVGYLAQHRGGIFALDRATGRPVWRYAAEPPASGAYGFPGSAAVGSGFVFFTGLDGRAYAFTE